MSASDSSPIFTRHSSNNKENIVLRPKTVMSDSDNSPIKEKKRSPYNDNKDKKSCSCGKKIDEFRSSMSKKLNKLEAQMKVMAEAQAEQNVFLRNLHKHGDQTLKDARSVFPIKTEEDLLSLNSKISSENRVLYINTIRSYFQPQGVKKNLKFILSSELVDQYNVDGNHGKKGLKLVDKFFHVLLDAIGVSSESGAAEHQLRQAIFLQKKRFLKQKSTKK